MTTSTASNLSNHLLMAMPGMADPNFDGAVVLLAEHSDKGALGLVINRPLELTIERLFDRIDLKLLESRGADEMVLFGGPVQSDRGFVLHNPGVSWNSTIEIGDSLALTSSKDVLEAVAAGKGPENLLITLGCSGWGPGQLEQELAQNAWLSVEADADIIFKTACENRLNKSFGLLGVDPSLLSGTAGHA